MPLGVTPDSRLRATSPCFIPPSHIARWFASSDIPEGRTSRLCPDESQQTGTGEGWQAHPAGGKVFYPRPAPTPARPIASSPSSITDLLSPSSVIRHPGTPGNHYDRPRILPSRPAIVSQAGPQKAHLLAILRMRSNMAPGEASLRFKKWVFWNAWTRREQAIQQQFFQRQLTIPTIVQPKAQVDTQAWTGNEVFDENGDMVTSESTSSEDSEEEEQQQEDDEKVHTILLVSGHLTPPPSPVEEPGVPTATPRAIAVLEVKRAEQQDERPPTPPPSPPSGPSLSVMGCHA